MLINAERYKLLNSTFRELVESIRRLERELYLVQKAIEESSDNPDLMAQSWELDAQLEDKKHQLNSASEELAIMIR